jgi:hypothetical protein
MGLTRRALLRDGGALTLAVFVARDASALGGIGVELPKDGQRAFLGEGELATLRAAVDRFVPGKPEDVDDGAVAAGCAEAIDALLGAFATDPPRIYAGGPFSDRAGSSTNHFASFTPLDPYEQKAWRLRIEGSNGRPELEWGGQVKGFQQVYREGLAALERQAGPLGFATLPGPARDAILRNDGDAAIAAFVDIAFPHTLELLYGAPEYGGNRDLLAWRYTSYAGDVQPRGWTRAEIEQPAAGGPLPDVGLPLPDLLGYAALGSAEVAHGIVARSGGTLSGLRKDVEPAVRRARGG